MAYMTGVFGLGLKLLALLVAFALVPIAIMGIISLAEMNRASIDVQNNISSLSTSLNRSALAVAPNDADQVQLAIAKSRQYNEFFRRIASENELVASYAAMSEQNESCKAPPGIWVAPSGSNQTTSAKREATIRSLCFPARIMQKLLSAEQSLSLSYIGTEDGVLLAWPYSNETISNAALFGYKDMQYYSQAKAAKKTIWTGPYVNDLGQVAITVTTPIYRAGEFVGIVGMDVSLKSIDADLSSMKGRGYPFVVDSSGRIILQPSAKPEGSLRELFASDNLTEANSPDAKRLAQKMIKGDFGSTVVGLKDADGYVAFSPITAIGWSFGIAYPAEEMSLPARFIDAVIKDVARSTTRGLNDARNRTQVYAQIIFVLTAAIVLVFGIFLSRRISSQIDSLASAAERLSRGEFDVEVKVSGDMEPLGEAFNKMAQGLKSYAARLEGEAEERGGSGKESAFLNGIKRNLAPATMPVKDGYEILALYNPSEKNGFDIYDVVEANDKIALAMAGVEGDGVQAAMLAVMSRALIRVASEKLDPSKAIADINSQINQHAHGMNLACFYALLDPVNHTMEYVNAGFNPPFIVDRGGMVDTLGGGGIALGMLDRMDLQKERIPIQPGDVMVMYSNGVVETENIYRKHFGVERLINLVISNRGDPASKILSVVHKELKDYSKNQTAKSDVTIVMIKRS
ncbi:MAG: SpoIIE family protein phosphatase [Methanothrix sp.]|nr:SpoIIE family protein phosphatase [Methanothrix sp.]